uniref:NADH-ubiquinone oxidoreductase chain 1 n=1 Tax=Vallicula multiformis TaxID=140489 RepID=A0A2R4ZLC0_9METZ|nr:NADH dehydrogenase subunit 1 [Vallicula multiformis]
MEYLLLNIIIFFCLVLMVPFLIFCERRILGVFQLRLGVFIYFFNSLFLFLADALKILSKFNVFFYSGSKFFYLFSLFMFFFFILYQIFFFFGYTSIVYFFCSIYVFLIFFAFLPFPLINISFLQNSVYSFLGNIRNLFLMISYEICLIFCLIIFLFGFYGKFVSFSNYIFFYLINLAIICFVSVLCETSRVPFDLIEGESELVSGFNTELGSIPFIVIFLSEYLILVIFTVLINVYFGIPFFLLLIIFLFSRALLVRFLYMKVVSLFWHSFIFYLNLFFFAFVYVNF